MHRVNAEESNKHKDYGIEKLRPNIGKIGPKPEVLSANVLFQKEERENVLIFSNNESNHRSNGKTHREPENLIVAFSYPQSLVGPRRRSRNQRIKQKQNYTDDASDHEVVCHLFTIYLPNHIGHDENDWETKNPH
jgi:hypothetical protein